MNRLETLFKKYLAANGGNEKEMWFIIKRFDKYLDYECRGNNDLKHSIIVHLFDYVKTLDGKFEEYFKEINR